MVGYQQGNPLRGPVGVFFRFGEHITGVMGKTHIFFKNFTPKPWGKRIPNLTSIFFVGGLVQPPTGINSLHARSLASFPKQVEEMMVLHHDC